MAIIYTYKLKNNAALDDLVLISDVEDGRKTKNVKLSGIKDALDVVDSIIATLPLEASSATGNVTLSLKGLSGFGSAGQIIKVNAAGNALEYGSASAGDTYDLNATQDGDNVDLNLISGSGTDNSVVQFTAGANITLTRNDANQITIASTGGSGSALTVSQGGVAVDTDVTDINFISGFAAVDDSGTAGKVDLNAVYNTALDNTIATENALGGIAAGTTVADLKGDTIVSLFDALLFPTVNPRYFIPTRSLSSSVTGTKEVGTTHNPAISAGGTKNDAGAYTDITIKKSINGGTATTLASGTPTESSASNLADQFGFANANNPNKSYTKTHTDSSLVIPAPASGNTSTVVYSSTANYSAGNPLKDNKGNFDTRSAAVRSISAPQAAANNFASVNRTITGLYPYYYLKSSSAISNAAMVTAIGNGTATAVVASASGTISIPYNVSSQFLAVAYPATNTTKTKYYVTALDNGDITVVFNAVATLEASSPNSYWEDISYKIHTSNSALTNSNPTIQLRNS
jgi:hypothetical protein